MPSKSAKQHRFMEAIAHNPAFAKKAGVPQSVGKDYAAADKGKTFARGGRAMAQKINRQDTKHGEMDMPFNSLKKFTGIKSGGSVESKAMVKKEVEFFKKKGAPASMIKHEKAEMKGMKRGGMTMRPVKDIQDDQKKVSGKMLFARGGGIESKGKTKGTMIKMASGGFVRSADGIASKGKTKGKMC